MFAEFLNCLNFVRGWRFFHHFWTKEGAWGGVKPLLSLSGSLKASESFHSTSSLGLKWNMVPFYKVFFHHTCLYAKANVNFTCSLTLNPNKASYNLPVETNLKITRGPFLESQGNHLHLFLYFLTPVLSVIQSRTPYFHGKPDNKDSSYIPIQNPITRDSRVCGHCLMVLEVVRIERLVLSYEDLESGRQ